MNLRIMLVLALAALSALAAPGCALNRQFEDDVAACTGQPLTCFQARFGPTKGDIQPTPNGSVYRFEYFFRDLYGTCFGNVVLDPKTGRIAGGYLDGEGCEFY